MILRPLVVMLALALGMSLPAQQESQRRPAPRDASAPAPVPQSAARPGLERQRLERRLHERMARVVRDQLQLSEEQLAQLTALNQRYEGRRRGLIQGERSTRVELRQQLRLGDRADQKRVAALLDQAMQAQQSRLDLSREEQRELSTFLTPVQRAKYMALQEQLRERVDELRRGERRRNERPRRAEPRRSGDGTHGLRAPRTMPPDSLRR